jgi:hypothetical protein
MGMGDRQLGAKLIIAEGLHLGRSYAGSAEGEILRGREGHCVGPT